MQHHVPRHQGHTHREIPPFCPIFVVVSTQQLRPRYCITHALPSLFPAAARISIMGSGETGGGGKRRIWLEAEAAYKDLNNEAKGIQSRRGRQQQQRILYTCSITGVRATVAVLGERPAVAAAACVTLTRECLLTANTRHAARAIIIYGQPPGKYINICRGNYRHTHRTLRPS